MKLPVQDADLKADISSSEADHEVSAFWTVVDWLLDTLCITIQMLFNFIDYFGYIRRYFCFVHDAFWKLSTCRLFAWFPIWLWYLLYLYLVIATHLLFVLLFTRMTYDHFITEPREKKEEAKKAKER